MPLCYKVCSCYATTTTTPVMLLLVHYQLPCLSPPPPFPHYCFSLKIPLLAHHSSLTRLRSFCWAFFTAMSRLLSYQVACLVYCTKDFFLGFVIISEPCWWLQCWSHSELTTISTNNPDFSSPPTNAASVCHSIQFNYYSSIHLQLLLFIQFNYYHSQNIVLYCIIDNWSSIFKIHFGSFMKTGLPMFVPGQLQQ